MYTNFVDQFHELDKTIKSQDPYKNFENKIAPIVDSDILTTLLYENETDSDLNPSDYRKRYNFYQKQGACMYMRATLFLSWYGCQVGMKNWFPTNSNDF